MAKKALSAADKQAKKFLETYLNTVSPTGNERAGQIVWSNYIHKFMKPVDYFESDAYGNMAAIIKGQTPYKVVIEAHADEISWMVSNINTQGMISVVRNGGSDSLIAPSMRVKLHGSKGSIDGFFGSPAIHVRDGKKEFPTPEDLSIDIGAESKEEAMSLGIDIGAMVTFSDGFIELNDKYYVGRALDDRICGYINTQVVRELYEQNIMLPYTLCVVNSVQEEVGLRGAEMMAARLSPDVAICLDVGHDTQTRGYNKIKQGDIYCGNGPIISYAAPVQPMLRTLLEKTAQKNKIPFQKRAIPDGRSTGTDTDSFAYNGIGRASALVSLPMKYMHTTNEMVHKNDVENVQKLVFQTLKEITATEEQFDPLWKQREKLHYK